MSAHDWVADRKVRNPPLGDIPGVGFPAATVERPVTGAVLRTAFDPLRTLGGRSFGGHAKLSYDRTHNHERELR